MNSRKTAHYGHDQKYKDHCHLTNWIRTNISGLLSLQQIVSGSVVHLIRVLLESKACLLQIRSCHHFFCYQNFCGNSFLSLNQVQSINTYNTVSKVTSLGVDSLRIQLGSPPRSQVHGLGPPVVFPFSHSLCEVFEDLFSLPVFHPQLVIEVEHLRQFIEARQV